MSLLSTAVYANGSTPLWLAAGGGGGSSHVITGDLEVTGDVTVGGDTYMGGDVFISGGAAPNNTLLLMGDAPGVHSLELRGSSAGLGTANVNVSQGGTLHFSFVGANGSGSTNIKPGLFAYTDVIQLGGATTIQGPLNLPGAIMGSASIPVGQTNVVVPCATVNGSSTVLITRMGAVSAGPGAGSAQGTIVVNRALIVANTSFRADLTDITGVSTAASVVDAEFTYIVIGASI